MLVEPEEPAPYPDIPAEADKEQVMLAAENSGLDFSSVPTKVTGGEVIEILNDEEEEAINKFVQEGILMKVELNQKEEVLQDAIKTAKGEKPRRSAQAHIVNR